jgi:hypothetical protein
MIGLSTCLVKAVVSVTEPLIIYYNRILEYVLTTSGDMTLFSMVL